MNPLPLFALARYFSARPTVPIAVRRMNGLLKTHGSARAMKPSTSNKLYSSVREWMDWPCSCPNGFLAICAKVPSAFCASHTAAAVARRNQFVSVSPPSPTTQTGRSNLNGPAVNLRLAISGWSESGGVKPVSTFPRWDLMWSAFSATQGESGRTLAGFGRTMRVSICAW